MDFYLPAESNERPNRISSPNDPKDHYSKINWPFAFNRWLFGNGKPVEVDFWNIDTHDFQASDIPEFTDIVREAYLYDGKPKKGMEKIKYSIPTIFE